MASCPVSHSAGSKAMLSSNHGGVSAVENRSENAESSANQLQVLSDAYSALLKQIQLLSIKEQSLQQTVQAAREEVRISTVLPYYPYPI